ncbi:glycoside hydrolase family 97 protein [Sphingomonas cavernae]|uniref:Glycoside hydrolase family 97 protein n=1 Tax=Sphingomonas cavernae TaxID=2320861 RepID=A0A418W8B8_9SPHN|nr:glycoside hydrolase family 97 protein [Sphingomonas cavernae]RJF86243.1 glycoside hydrolase family 97 protein [Sphingomonas cavernae]
MVRLGWLVATAALGLAAASGAQAAPVALASPDGAVSVTIDQNADGAPTYAVTYHGEAILAPSPLGLAIVGGALGPGLAARGTTARAGEDAYTLPLGKTARARDRYNELTVDYVETKSGTGAPRKLQIIFRAYDDGVAFRYRLPATPSPLSIRNEMTGFAFPADYACHGLNLGNFRTAHEGEYDPVKVSQIRPMHLFETPLVCRTGEKGISFAIAEADLTDWAGMYLSGRSDGGRGVEARLSPRLDMHRVAVTTRGGAGVQSPWRVVMLGENPLKLIESTLILSLNPAPKGDFSWVKPGKSAWDWWNGPVLKGVPRAGMNDATIRGFIDFAAASKLEYMLIDDGWYLNSGGGGTVYPGADPTRAIPEINIAELVDYGRNREVGLWLWVHWSMLDTRMDEVLALYQRWGIKGIKVDFMDRDDQQMVDFYHRVLESAARHRLMVDLHGAYRPTGLQRTWPNYLTQEGVLGAEYNKWTHRITATHNVTLPFTRMLLGPMDYTPGGFLNVTPEDFAPRINAPQVMTTRGAALAMYVVYESPFVAVSDSPDSYAGQAGLDFISAVPASWDETRALAGEIGEHVVIARRKGRDWWIGAMTNEQARTVRLPLDFLGKGRFDATIDEDGESPTALRRTKRQVGASDVLELKLAGSGGAAVVLRAR